MSTAKNLIECDFVPQGRPRTPLSITLFAFGVLLAGAALAVFFSLDGRRAGLELRLAAIRHTQTPLADPSEAVDARLGPSLQLAAQDLATPWTLLLSELEKAAKDSANQVSVLGVEPDHAKHSVRISAEARNLPLALAYVRLLQSSRSIEYPMLDRHELRVDDPQHPVRFEMTGVWRDQP
jgi:hypothetical protein